MKLRPSRLALLLIVGCLVQHSCAAREQTPKELMRIGDELVSLEAGKVFVQAQSALQNNQFDGAARLLKQFLVIYPNSSAAHYKFGYVLLQQGKNSEAFDEAKKCTELNAKLFAGWALLGESAMNLNRKQESINAYQKALAIESTGENADIIREHLAELTKNEKTQTDETAEKTQEIVRQNDAIMKTNRALSLCDEANVLLKQKQFEPGLQKCRDAMKIDSNSPQVKDNFAAYLNNYASDCVQQQDLKHAEELIKEAVSLQASPGVAAATRLTSLKNYAALLKFQGRDAEAKDIEAKIKAVAQ